MKASLSRSNRRRVFSLQGIFVLRGFQERLSRGRLYWRLERALSLLDFGADVDDFGGGGRPSAAGSSSSASHGGGGDWRCTDSTSARSWHHFIASAVAPPPSALPHPVLVATHHQQQQHKLADWCRNCVMGRRRWSCICRLVKAYIVVHSVHRHINIYCKAPIFWLTKLRPDSSNAVFVYSLFSIAFLYFISFSLDIYGNLNSLFGW